MARFAYIACGHAGCERPVMHMWLEVASAAEKDAESNVVSDSGGINRRSMMQMARRRRSA